jgi:hypothetical protein
MVKVGIFVRLMAKPGKATEVEQLLMAGRALVLNRFTLKRDHRNRATWPAIFWG